MSMDLWATGNVLDFLLFQSDEPKSPGLEKWLISIAKCLIYEALAMLSYTCLMSRRIG
jgi:hypothetical protein